MKIILDPTWPRDEAPRALLGLMREHLTEATVTLALVVTQEVLPFDASLAVMGSAADLSGPPGRELSRHEAAALLFEVTRRDLAYGQPRTTDDAAAAIRDAFLAAFGPAARFFTNGELGLREGRGTSWMPLTKATFDTGVFVADGTRHGLLWFEDED